MIKKKPKKKKKNKGAMPHEGPWTNDEAEVGGVDREKSPVVIAEDLSNEELMEQIAMLERENKELKDAKYSDGKAGTKAVGDGEGEGKDEELGSKEDDLNEDSSMPPPAKRAKKVP